MKIQVLLFAAAKEAAGSSSVQVELTADANAGDVIGALAKEVPALTDLLPSCRLALDCCYVASDQAIAGASEIALIPPVSGG